MYKRQIHGRGWAVPVLRCTLYSGSSGCALNAFVMVDVLHLAFGTLYALCLAFHQPSMAQTVLRCLFLHRERGHPPRQGRGPPVMGRGQGRTPSQSPAWQTGSRNSLVDECLQIYPRLHRPCDTCSNCWPLDEHHFPGVLAICSSIETDDPSL